MPRQLKDSGIKWIGMIPEEWNVLRVKDGFVRKKSEAHQDNPIVLSLARSGVKIRDLSKNEGQIAESYYNYNPVEPDDFLLNPMDLYSGANCSISKVSGVISPAYINLRYKPGFDPLYYDYYFKTQYWAMAMFAHGKGVSFDNRWTLSAVDLLNYYIPHPSIQEQKSISRWLNDRCQRIDAVLEQTQNSISEYKSIKKAMITQAVTKGVRGNRKMRDSAVEWLGSIPEDWTVYRIANLYDERSESGLEELPILTVSINTGVSDHEIADEDKDRVFVRSEDRTKYKRVYPGDLAYNMMRAWQGAFGAVRVDGMVSPAYVVAKPKKNVEVDSRYMEALLRTSEATEEMHRYSRGIVDFRLRLYWPEFKNIRICLPPIAEQIEIADYIDEKSAAIDALIAKKEAFAAELENYKKSMIYEYVTGKKEVPQS